MAQRNPYDPMGMFPMFNPDDVRKVFDPQRMFTLYDEARTQPFDMTSVFDTNRKNFDAMVEANRAAAAAYQDLLQKQMDIFTQLTTAARDHVAWIEENSGPEAMTKKTEAYTQAVERALVLMRKLADTARDANEEAYVSLKGQVNEAMEDLKKTTTQAKGGGA